MEADPACLLLFRSALETLESPRSNGAEPVEELGAVAGVWA